MRHAAISLFVAGMIIIFVWWLWPVEREWEDMVPADLLGLLLINRFPDSLDFLPQTRMGNWLDIESQEGFRKRFEEIDHEWLTALKLYLRRAGLVIHTIDRKESGAFRLHVTALLQPKPNQCPMVERWIHERVLERFGRGSTRVIEESAARIYRGEKKGEVVYLKCEDDWLLVSNTEPGWKDFQLVLAGRAPRLVEKSTFRDIRAHVDLRADLFFYFSGAGLPPLFDEFGYSVTLHDDGVTDSYWEVETKKAPGP